jgi:hypothetical protein
LSQGPPQKGCVQALSDDVGLYKKMTTIFAISSTVLFLVFITSVIFSIQLKRYQSIQNLEEPKAFQKLVEEQ